MTELTKLDPNHSALLTLDCQKGISAFVPGADVIYGPAAKVVQAARAKKILVIHVGIGFRPGYPEVNPDHPTFGKIRETGRFVTGTESAEFHDGIKPLKDEITVVKHRVSAFSGNDLEMILRSQRIHTLILFGIATSGIVLSTVRQACDMDFRCVVIKDCCFDRDEEVHHVLTEKVFAHQTTVVDAAQFCAKMLD